MARPRPGSPSAALLRHGIDHGQCLAMVETRNDGNELISFWPMLGDVGTHRLTLRRGHLWPNRLEAQLEARSEEHTSELQSLMRISYAVFCLKKKKKKRKLKTNNTPLNTS